MRILTYALLLTAVSVPCAMAQGPHGPGSGQALSAPQAAAADAAAGQAAPGQAGRNERRRERRGGFIAVPVLGGITAFFMLGAAFLALFKIPGGGAWLKWHKRSAYSAVFFLCLHAGFVILRR